MRIEPLAIDSIQILSVGTTAQDVKICHDKYIIIQNQHATQTLHIKEKSVDGTAVTESNGYIIYPKESSIPLSVNTLSIIASGASTTAAILILK